MNYDQINQQLETIRKTKNIEDVQSLVCLLLEPLGIVGCKPEELLNHSSVQREFSRFMPAQGFRDRAAAYTIKHTSDLPVDIKLYWIKKTTKANLSWLMALTPNYEDNPEINTSMNLGIDIIVSENCESIYLVLSSMLKVRVLELNGVLSHTQREILENWQKIGSTTDSQSENFKQELHKLLWKSFDFEPINRKFYQELVTQFDHLVLHLKPIVGEASAKMFAVRFIGRTLFLWFLRKKDFINPEKEYFNVSGSDDQSLYYHSKLESLFFEVLNTEVKSRSFDDFVTPFLNGGLFEPIETDFYRDEKLTFPEGFFTQFFDVLNRYNFTVDEGTSEYEQVAVDPEMLGRVFENLLASINDETGGQARKSKGAFYTPREIVDYMCKQSLIEYLKTKLPDTANRDRRIEELVTMDEATFRDQDHNKRRDWKKDLGQETVLKALDELRILDPAVGSGAFPMGMLNLLVKVYTRIDTSREKDLATLKREILSRSLYGVDIDQMAIQISRLRAWLSILVDMESLKKIDPLPNLDFKFVCANTLIALDEGPNSLFDTDIELKKHLIDLRDKYYAATRKVDKGKIRKEYLFSIQKGGELFASKRELQLRDYNPFNPLNSTNFYDPELMHGVESFDVVIGNPPYVQLQKFARTQIQKDLENEKYQTFAKTGDLYALFYEKGLNLTSLDSGLLCYITSNKWMRAGYGESLRRYFVQHNPLLLLDLGSGVFESATVDSNILLIQNTLNKGETKAVTIKDNKKSFSTQLQEHGSVVNFDSSGPWFIGTQVEINLKNKIETNGKPLKDWDVSINYGIKTGLNEAFIINQEKRDELIAQDLKSEEIIKPILRGRDIKRYSYNFSGLYLLMTGFDFDIPVEYPVVFNHLKQFEEKAKKRDDQGKNWWNLRACVYYDEFEKEKIVWGNIAYNSTFSVLGSSYYLNAPGNLITSNSTSLKFLLGCLNSKIFNWEFKKEGIFLGNAYEWKKQYVEQIHLPLKQDSQSIKKIESIVEKIIYLKKINLDADTKDLEAQIDQLVYHLYDLTEDEIKIIEES